jgi:hypothetical protein
VPSDRDAAPEPEPQRHVRLACQSPASGTLFSQSKPATSNHYFPLRTNQHQPSATSQTNWLNQNQAEFRAHHTELVMISIEQSRCGTFTTDCVSNFRPSLKNRICFSACTRGGQLLSKRLWRLSQLPATSSRKCISPFLLLSCL